MVNDECVESLCVADFTEPAQFGTVNDDKTGVFSVDVRHKWNFGNKTGLKFFEFDSLERPVIHKRKLFAEKRHDARNTEAGRNAVAVRVFVPGNNKIAVTVQKRFE